MKICIITQKAPLYIPEYLKKITTDKNNEYLIIFIPPFISKINTLVYNFNFWGINGFLILIFKILNYYIKPLFFVQESLSKYLDVRKIKFIYKSHVKNSEKIIANFSPDILISLACPQKIDLSIIKMARLGSYNIHSSLLPKYKGINAIFWAMLNDEKEIGVTLHIMNEELDEGDIIIQKKINIYENETYDSIANRVIQVGSDIINNFIANFNLFYGNGVKQEKIDSYFSYPQKKDRILFHNRGKRFFNKYV